jgi:ATP-dependent RNA helicase A
LASATLEQLSDDLLSNARDRKMNDNELIERTRARETLPIHAMRSKIMEYINDNPVVLIRGNTGCGKNFCLKNFWNFELTRWDLTILII